MQPAEIFLLGILNFIAYSIYACESHALYKMCSKQFITHIIVVAAEGLWHLGSLFYHNTQYSQRVIYRFILVWYSTKQCPSNRPTSHLVHLYTATFLWPCQAYRRECIWIDDFPGHCLLWPSSSLTFPDPHLVFKPIWRWGDLVSFQLPQSNSSPEAPSNLCQYI